MTDQADDDRRTAMLLMAERLVELEPLARNRWLAFSDHELVFLRGLLNLPDERALELLGQVRVELLRRARELGG